LYKHYHRLYRRVHFLCCSDQASHAKENRNHKKNLLKEARNKKNKDNYNKNGRNENKKLNLN